MTEHFSQSAEETLALGRGIGATLSPPKLIVLRGDLGAGKTTITKGIAEGMHVAAEEEVTSPTFTLIHEYRSEDSPNTLYHIDLYRVDTERELETLGIDDLIADSNVLLVEWGDKFERFRKECDIEIAIARLAENKRKITVTENNRRG